MFGKKLAAGLLALSIYAVPQISYADWNVGVGFGPGYHEGGHFAYRWHDHPQWGWRVHHLPSHFATVWVGWRRYYYCDGLYYTYAGGDYVLVNPPAGAYVSAIPQDFQPVIIDGRTYFTNNGVYYIWTRHGYRVVGSPVRVFYRR